MKLANLQFATGQIRYVWFVEYDAFLCGSHRDFVRHYADYEHDLISTFHGSVEGDDK